MFEIKRYFLEQKNSWDLFVDNSKNGTFLFKRDYMDYHSDRFQDTSLMVYRKNKLHSILPANRVDDVLYSHQGLTYGGFIMPYKITTLEMLDIFKLVNNYLKKEGINKVIYKPIPYIYHSNPSQEDLYALFRKKAKIMGRNISSTISQNNKIKFIESRKSGIRKAINNSIEIKESNNFKAFWEILDNNLKQKYGIKPVHSLDEIELLHLRFPENIKLFLAQKNNIPLGGTIVYITKQVLHTQYITASIEGKELGVLDLLFDRLINQTYVNIPYFDFGQSTEQKGNLLNDALIFQKEGFGGRGVVYDIYEYEI